MIVSGNDFANSSISNCVVVIVAVDLFNEKFLNGAHEFEINTNDTADFIVNISIAIFNVTQLFYSCCIENPSNNKLENVLLYLELILNDINNLNGIFNITIQFNEVKYQNLEFWCFYSLANYGEGEWENIKAIEVNNGIIIVSKNHASIFAFTNKEHIPPLLRAMVGVEFEVLKFQKTIDKLHDLILRKTQKEDF